MKKSKQIALCSMLAALTLTMMFLGSVIWAFTYVAPLAGSVIMLIICDVANRKNAFLTYLAISIISVFFLPDKECALTYVFFFGYYVIIRDSIEKIKPKALSFTVKVLIYNVGIISSQLLLIYVFNVPLDNSWGKWGIALLVALANIVFLTYELMLSRLIMLYNYKYKKRVHNLLK